MNETLFDVEREYVSSPTKFTLREIRAIDACQLNKEWHSRFPEIDWSNVVRNKHYVCFTADYKMIPYAVAIWSSPIAANRLTDGDLLLELRRLAICEYAPKNTATWMLGQMRKQILTMFPDVIRLISYQDTEAHHGTIYKAANWIPKSQSDKGYDWTTKDRKRTNAQSLASKVRWELDIKRKEA